MSFGRYGYTPLPRVFDRDAWDTCVAACVDPDLTALARHWYQLDENAVPAEYILRSLSSMGDKDYWDDAYPKLLKLFQDVSFDRTSPELLVGRSITEWEVKSARAGNSDPSKIVWMHRTFANGVPASDPHVGDFDDATAANGKSAKLADLKDWMTASIPSDKIKEYDACSFDSFQTKDVQWTTLLHKFRADALSCFSDSLDAVIKTKEAWDNNALGLGDNFNW